jgi:LysR family transcriptional regulator, regulator for genes of the gallate degradation pathway
MSEAPDLVGVLPSLRQLRCFLLAAEHGSVGRAAEEIGMSQPAASNAVARLEAQFGARLLDRNTAGSVPTPAGEVLHVRAGRFFASLADAFSHVGSDERRSGHLAATMRRVHVRALIAVAETGTFTSAAARLAISGPALHRAARELETLVRAPLFQRRPNGIGVNATGESLARRFRLAAHEIVQAIEELGPNGRVSGTKITAGVLPLLPKRWMARAIVRAKRATAELAVELREASYATLVQELRWGSVDLIIGALPPDPPEADVTQKPLFADPYVLVVRRGHPLTRARRLTRAMLAKHDWVVPSDSLPRRAVVENFFATLPARPRIWLDTSSPGSMTAAVEETDCITLVSRTQLLMDGAPNLAILPVTVPDGGRTVGITQRRDWLPTPVQRAFVDALVRTSPECT